MSPRIEGRWTKVDLTRRPGGWRRFYGLPEVPGYSVAVRYVMEDGAPRFAGLRVEPEDDDAAGLPAAVVRALPIADMVTTSAFMAFDKIPADADSVQRGDASTAYLLRQVFDADAPMDRPKGGSPEFHAAVAAVWKNARKTGYPGGGNKAIRDVWGLGSSPYTAERWVREARRAGFIEPSQRVIDAKSRNKARKGKGK